MAQRLARSTHNRQAPGSNPGGATKLVPQGPHPRGCGPLFVSHALREVNPPRENRGTATHPTYPAREPWHCHTSHVPRAGTVALPRIRRSRGSFCARNVALPHIPCNPLNEGVRAHIDIFLKTRGLKSLEATTGFEPVVRALQAPALPLGHVAIQQAANGHLR